MAGRAHNDIVIFSRNSNPGLVDEICDYIGLPRGRADVRSAACIQVDWIMSNERR